jgi:hypothetical protein
VGLRLRVGRVVVYAWLLAAVPIAALQLVHADLHEFKEPPPFFHFLRDTGLAVPAAAVAVVLSALLVSRAWSGTGRQVTPITALVWGCLAAGLFAVLSLPGNEAHGLLFGAEHETGVGVAEDLLGDGIAALQAALLVVLPVALVAGVPWRDHRPAAPVPAGSADGSTAAHDSTPADGSTPAGATEGGAR